MQAALYFPYIGVPPTAWWTRTMLYWDKVATIVPGDYIDHPELHHPYTLQLIQAELLHQVLPSYAGSALEIRFEKYLHRLSGSEIDRRRHDFSMGSLTSLHPDKWLTYAAGLTEVQRLGLAALDDFGEWILVEAATAAEFMAALALSICEEAGANRWLSSDRSRAEWWVPTTDMPPAIRALLAGLEPVSGAFEGEKLHMRVRGELKAAEVRTHLMERLLPVPETAVPVEKLVAFRRKHGDLLPAFRRYLESNIDESLMITDPILRSRFMDRIEDELQQRCEEAEAYLAELGLRRISRSSLLRALKFFPGLQGPVGTAQDLAENLQTRRGLEAEPLAYLAFAHAAFVSMQSYRVDPSTGIPLVELMQRDSR